MLRAAQRGLVQDVREHLRLCHIDTSNRAGDTALHLAAAGGFAVIADVLLRHGANVNAQNAKGETPLARAAAAGHEAVVALLLNQRDSLELELCDSRGLSALHVAASRGHVDVLLMLLQAIALLPVAPARPSPLGAFVKARTNVGMTALHCAAAHGHTSCIRAILKDVPDCIDLQDSQGYSALHFAAKNNHADAFAALAHAGAQLGLRTHAGMSPGSMTSSPLVRAALRRSLKLTSSPQELSSRVHQDSSDEPAAGAAPGTAPAASIGEHGVNTWWAVTGASPDAYEAHRTERQGRLLRTLTSGGADAALTLAFARKLGSAPLPDSTMEPMTTLERQQHAHYRDFSIDYAAAPARPASTVRPSSRSARRSGLLGTSTSTSTSRPASARNAMASR